MLVEDGFCEYQNIEQFLLEKKDLKKVSGVFAIAFSEIRDVEFTNTDISIADPVSPSKLITYYNSSDKKHLLLASTDSLYDAIDSFYNGGARKEKKKNKPRAAKRAGTSGCKNRSQNSRPGAV